MPERSAGILLYRRDRGGLEVLLIHPGGPFFARRDAGAWSIPKGLNESGEEPLTCARREFAEELGSPCPDGPVLELGEIRQRNGKRVTAFAVEGDLDAAAVASNTFTIEWPPRSGRTREFPEVDRAAWFTLDAAREKLLAAQAPLLDRLAERLDVSPEQVVQAGDGCLSPDACVSAVMVVAPEPPVKGCGAFGA